VSAVAAIKRSHCNPSLDLLQVSRWSLPCPLHLRPPVAHRNESQSTTPQNECGRSQEDRGWSKEAGFLISLTERIARKVLDTKASCVLHCSLTSACLRVLRCGCPVWCCTMLSRRRKKMTPKTPANSNCPIPNEGGLGSLLPTISFTGRLYPR
jgi:hypothetical protein